MTTMQQTILKAIDDKMEPYPYTLDFKWANTGHIRALDPKTLAATRSLSFEFHDTNVSFREALGADRAFVASHTYGQERREGHIAAVKSSPMELVETVVAYLKGMPCPSP